LHIFEIMDSQEFISFFKPPAAEASPVFYFKLTVCSWRIHRSLEQMRTCTTGQNYQTHKQLLMYYSFPISLKGPQKTVGLIFHFRQCPRLRDSLQLLPTHHGVVGGDPLEMGTMRPWAKTKMGPEFFPVTSSMMSFIRLQDIAWP
jgi:hypothetical protein